MNFLDLLNMVAREARPAHHALSPMTDMETPFTETEIDSLDGLMIVMYMSIIYGIEDDLVKEFHPETPQILFDFLEQHKTQDPESIEHAKEMIK
jgi:acyl carrier protein